MSAVAQRAKAEATKQSSCRLVAAFWIASLRNESVRIRAQCSSQDHNGRRSNSLRFLQRRNKIFFAFALEFLLGGFEACHARGDFFAFRRKHVLLFGHACPFDSCPASMVAANGARMRRLSCRIVVGLNRSSRAGVGSIEGIN